MTTGWNELLLSFETSSDGQWGWATFAQLPNWVTRMLIVKKLKRMAWLGAEIC